MRNIYMRLCIIAMFVLTMASCSVFEEPNPFDENVTPFTSIIFKLSDTAPDNLNITSGSFRVSCNAKVFIKLTGATSSVQVYRFNTVNNTKELKTTITPVNGVAVLDVPVVSLTLGGVAPVSGNSLTMEFTAVSSDGKTTTRRFTISVTAAGPC